jgi:hypothetical protein
MTEQSIGERAARALFESQPRIERWDDLDPNSKSIFLHKACKVIKAIREPSEAMIEAALPHCWVDWRESVCREFLPDIWKAMIDAAFAE